VADEAFAAEWELLRPMIVESPADVLPDLADLVGRMLAASGRPVAGAAATADDLAAQYLQARAVSDAAAAGEELSTTALGDAVAQLRELYDVLSREAGV
jgi:hypothetical protein